MKTNDKNIFASIIMSKSGETKVAKENFYGAKKSAKIWDTDVNNIAFSNLVKTKSNFKYLIGYLDKVIRPLVLIWPKMSGYVKISKVKDGDKDKNNKLISFNTDGDNLLEKYKTIWSKIADFKDTELNALAVYDDRYIKTKIRTYGDKVYNNFRGSNVPEDGVEFDYFIVTSIDSLLVYENILPASLFRQLSL